MGFDSIFRDININCISTTSFSAIIEGSPTWIVKAWRGVRQGDALSPLFIYNCSWVFEKDGKFGCGERRDGTICHAWFQSRVSHWIADDIVFFCSTNRKSLKFLKSTLEEFSEFSYLKINHNKSFTIFSIKVQDHEQMENIPDQPLPDQPFRGCHNREGACNSSRDSDIPSTDLALAVLYLNRA